jgi:uncharacterized protein YecE (DUF72 family)
MLLDPDAAVFAELFKRCRDTTRTAERRRVSFRHVAYDHETRLRKLREAKLVAQVVRQPPQGVWRRVEKYKARWARYRAERQ